MTTQVAESQGIREELACAATPRSPEGVRGLPLAIVVLAPIVAAILAFGIHRFVPNSQPTPLVGWYARLLGVVLLVSIALGAVLAVWPRSRAWIRHHAPLLAAAVAAVAVWDTITLKLDWLPLPYFPGPDLVLKGLWDDRLMLADSAYHSFKLLLSGYSVGVVAGLISGILIGWFRAVRYWGMPVLKLIGPIPATAFIPLAMALFTDAFASGTMLIAMAVWFPVTMLTSSGIANVPVSYLDVARTLGAGRLYLITRVAIPSALPSMFIGLFMGLGAAFLTLIVAETIGVKSGLGWYLKWQQGYVEYAKVYAALVIMSLFFSGLMTLLFKVRDRVLGWQKGTIRW